MLQFRSLIICVNNRTTYLRVSNPVVATPMKFSERLSSDHPMQHLVYSLRPFRSMQLMSRHRHFSHSLTCQAQPDTRRYAVIGGGFAGLAVSYHLLAANSHRPVHLDLYEGFGLGAGGSGAAAGLLHPYNARGKLLHCGLESFKDALYLLEVVERHLGAAALTEEQRIAWRHGLLRPVKTAKQIAAWDKFVTDSAVGYDITSAHCVDAAGIEALIPGFDINKLLLSMHQQQVDSKQHKENYSQQQGGAGTATANKTTSTTAGFMIPGGVVLHPQRYMQGLWAACQAKAAASQYPSSAAMHQHTITSLTQLEYNNNDDNGDDNGNNGGGVNRSGADYDAVIVSAGAAIDCIEELQGLLPLELCQGYTLDLKPSSSSSSSDDHNGNNNDGGNDKTAQMYPDNAPSILGGTYLAAHGTQDIVVGATKQYGYSPEAALEQCRLKNSNLYNNTTDNNNNSSSSSNKTDTASSIQHDIDDAIHELLPTATDLWPPLQHWQVTGVRSGVRALPEKTPLGTIPYAGKVYDIDCTTSSDMLNGSDSNVWVIGGLGARGLLYHAWLGRLVAEAVVAGDDDVLPMELRRWQK